MLEVKIDKILPITEARDSFNKIVDDVEESDELYVLTKNGKPTAVMVGVHHLEKLTGTSHEELMGAAAAAGTVMAEETNKQEENMSTNSNITPPIESAPPASTMGGGNFKDIPPVSQDSPSMSPQINNVAPIPQDNSMNVDVPKTDPASNTPAADGVSDGSATNVSSSTGEAPVSSSNSASNSTSSVSDPLDFLDDINTDKAETPAPATTEQADASTPPIAATSEPVPVNPATIPGAPADNTIGPNQASSPDDINPQNTTGTTNQTPPASL